MQILHFLVEHAYALHGGSGSEERVREQVSHWLVDDVRAHRSACVSQAWGVAHPPLVMLLTVLLHAAPRPLSVSAALLDGQDGVPRHRLAGPHPAHALPHRAGERLLELLS